MINIRMEPMINNIHKDYVYEVLNHRTYFSFELQLDFFTLKFSDSQITKKVELDKRIY